ARPARSGFVLGRRREQRRPAGGAGVRALLVVAVVLAGERRLGGRAAAYGILLGAELGAPLRVGLADLLVHRILLVARRSIARQRRIRQALPPRFSHWTDDRAESLRRQSTPPASRRSGPGRRFRARRTRRRSRQARHGVPGRRAQVSEEEQERRVRDVQA